MGWLFSSTRPIPQLQRIQIALPRRHHELLPVPLTPRGRRDGGGVRAAAARTSLQIVNEFRGKMKMAEELISKLTFSLREIQGLRRRPARLGKTAPRTKSEAPLIHLDRHPK